jgi:pyruvate dehydrogenase E1 component alpha subunit
MSGKKESKKILLDLYETMLLIRLFEESLVDPIIKKKIKTPCHLYSGEEAIATGICANLNKKDVLFSNHRSHGHYLAKGGSLKKLLAEIFGKKTGCSKGRGGSMHITDYKKGMIGSVPIVAGTISLAVGASLLMKIKKEKRVAISFFGDGATAEGVFYESLNFAALKKLPVIFVCENNLYATHMPIKDSLANKKIHKMAEHFMPSYKIDGNDVLEVYKKSRELVERSKKREGPFFIEALTYRQRGHVGPDDNIQGEHTDIRNNKEIKEWLKKDPIKRFEKYLFNNHYLNESLKRRIYQKIEKHIAKAYDFTESSSYPSKNSLLKHVHE